MAACSGEDDLLIRSIIADVCGTDLQIIVGIRDDTAKIIGRKGIVNRIPSPDNPTPCRKIFVINPASLKSGSAHLYDDRAGPCQEILTIPGDWHENGFEIAVPEAFDPLSLNHLPSKSARSG